MGHHGEVYESDFEKDKRRSVIKLMKESRECKNEVKALRDVFDPNKMVTTECFKNGFSTIVMEDMDKIGYRTLKKLLEMSEQQFKELRSQFTSRTEMIKPIINAMVIALHSVNIEKNYSHLDLNPGNIFVNVSTLNTCQSIVFNNNHHNICNNNCGGGCGFSNTRNPVVLGDLGCAKKMDSPIRLCDTNGHENYKSFQRYWYKDQQRIRKMISPMQNNEDIYSLGVGIFEMLLKFTNPDPSLFNKNVLFLLKFHGIEIESTDCNFTTIKVAVSNGNILGSNIDFTEIKFDSKFNSIISQIITFIQYYRTRPNAYQVLESLINDHQYSLNDNLPPIHIENPDDQYEIVDNTTSSNDSYGYYKDDSSVEITVTRNAFN
ncbi:hypothetical protein ACTFIU_007094 [Dictyostelium citrinum]